MSHDRLGDLLSKLKKEKRLLERANDAIGRVGDWALDVSIDDTVSRDFTEWQQVVDGAHTALHHLVTSLDELDY